MTSSNYESGLEPYHQKLLEMFELNNAPKYNIYLIQTRAEFDKLAEQKTENWMTGFTKDNTIFIIDPNKFEQLSCHPKSSFMSTLKHEISHIFYRQVIKSGLPNWLDEGFAVLNSEQNFPRADSISIDKLRQYHTGFDGEIYGIGASALLTIQKNGKKHELLKFLKTNWTEDSFYNFIT